MSANIIMFLLSLLWIGIGILIGLLANGAKLPRANWGRYGWLLMLGLGGLLALLTGWLGTPMLGKFFATPVAIWLTVLGVVLIPRFRFSRLQRI
jgi:hypothetical protein